MRSKENEVFCFEIMPGEYKGDTTLVACVGGCVKLVCRFDDGECKIGVYYIFGKSYGRGRILSRARAWQGCRVGADGRYDIGECRP
jgi:hypothetical protein